MAQQTCKQLQSDIADSNADKKGFDWNNLTPGGIIGSLGDAFGSRNKSQTFNTNINNTSISTTDITNIFNSCTNSSQSIVIIQSTSEFLLYFRYSSDFIFI